MAVEKHTQTHLKFIPAMRSIFRSGSEKRSFISIGCVKSVHPHGGNAHA